MGQPHPLPPSALADVQGLVTTGYGHLHHAAYLFVAFRDPAGAAGWLREVAPEVISGAPWPKGPDGRTVKPSSALSVALTAPGLQALGLPEEVVCTFPPEFQEGMAHPERARILGDEEESDPWRWELGGPSTPPVHAALILHAGTGEERAGMVARQREVLSRWAGAVTELPQGLQQGTIPEGHYEPFGFRDGMGQPRVLGIHGDGVPTGEFILGYRNHYGVIPPSPAVPGELDPAGILPPLANPHHADRGFRDLGLHGSFLVYRKLEQDVAGFWRFMGEEARRRGAGGDAAAAIRLAALCMGRWPGGAPLVLSPEEDDPALGTTDDFLYTSDPRGTRCPLGAHIRRTHPRDVIRPYGTEASLNMSRAHRLLRRGRIYGPPLFDPELLQDPRSPETARVLAAVEGDREPRGLHFLSVNVGIAGQFEFVQQAWCNNPRFNGLHDNPDPIIGRAPGPSGTSAVMTFPRGPFQDRTAPLPRFVTVRGGAYLFLPGITALRFLAGPAPPGG